MRPCYNKLENEPLPPFAENLVFWAPLTEGDLADHISGVSPTTDAGCSVTWDADKGMYLMKSNGRYRSSLVYRGMNMMMQDRHEVTIVADALIVRSNHSYNAIATTPELSRSASYNCAYIHEARNGSMNNVCRVAVSCPNTPEDVYYYPKFYNNGTYITEASWRASIQLSFNEVNVCETNNDLYYLDAYIKNVRIYNRALTAEEVAQL